MNFFKPKNSKVSAKNNGVKGYGVTWGKDCKNAATTTTTKWKHCNPKSDEDKLEARQMVYNLYNEKEASGVNVKLIIGEIARELGLSRSVAENTYNLEKAHSDPQASTSTDTANSPYSEFFDENSRLKRKHQLRPDQHEKFEDFKKLVLQELSDIKKQKRVPGGSLDAVAKKMQIPKQTVINIYEGERKSKSSVNTSKDDNQKAVYQAVCKYLKEKKCADDKILEKVSKDLSITYSRTKDYFSNELNDLATKDPRSFFYQYFEASFDDIAKKMAPNFQITIQQRIIFSYLEITDNFSFRCKSNDHKIAKVNFNFLPALRDKTNLFGSINKHMKSAHNVDVEEIKSRLTLEQIKKQYKVDLEVRRRVTFLNWAFDSSPKALGHIIAVVRCSSSIASPLSSSSPADDDSILTQLLPEFPGILDDHAWVFCFFNPGTVDGTFRCRLPHQNYQNIGVVFFDGGYKMHEGLKHHLNNHDIKGNYGKFNTEFTDKSGVTIKLNTVPDETRKLIKRLLEPTLPDVVSTSSTISDSDLQAMKTLTDALPQQFYGALCCFKPVFSDLQCFLPHLKSKSSRRLTFNFKQDDSDLELLWEKIKVHVDCAHNFTMNSFVDREWISDGINYISLTQMSIEMQKYYYDLTRHCLQVQPTSVQIAPSVPYTPALAAQLKPSLPDNASPVVEMAVVMSIPHVFFEIYDSEKELQDSFLVLDSIEELILDNDADPFIRPAETYHIFAQVPSTSKFDYIDRILYGGFTTTFERFQNHANNATRAYENRVPFENPKLYEHIAGCWNNNIEVFFGQLRSDMTDNQGSFSEYAVISFLQSLVQNHNHLHGRTTPFKDVLVKYKITYEQTVKLGAALLIDYHQKQKQKFHLLQPIPFDHSNMKPNPDAHLTLTTMLEDIIIPHFRLSDMVVDIKLHCSYALHLFVSLFTIRARLACYYLRDPTFLSRLQTENEDCYNEAYDLIESVLSQVQCTVDDCVEWAYGIWKRVFVTNVLVATEQPDFERRFPASAETYEVNLKFVSSAALLLAECVYAQGFTGNGDETKVREAAAAIFRRNSKSARGQLPPFSRVSKFSDLKNTDTSPKLRHLSNLPKFDAGTVVPIEPYQDMEPTRSFLVAAAQLRSFNYKNTLDMPSSFEPKHEFRFPVFLGSLNFIKLI